MEVEAEIVEEEESADAHMNITLSDPTHTRDVSVLGKFRETGAPICSSLGAMRPVLDKLVMLLLRDVTQIYSKKVRHGIHLLKIDVEEISSYLDELSEVEDPPPTANSWMNEVCDLSYDMEDYINSLIFVPPEDPSLVPNSINTTRSLCKLFSRAKTPKTSFIIAKTLSVFRMHILEAIERHQRYNLHSCTTLRRRFVSHGPMLLPTPYEETTNIVIDGRMNKFINSLANDRDQQLKVLSVLGSACLGKTTLATVLYNRFGKQYNCRAFIRVSKKPDTKRIFGDMLSQLQGQGPPQNCREIDIIENIKNYIRDKRYLIILDDIWAVSVWDIISHAFPNGSHGSRIITTTQIEDVALTCCYQAEQVFEMKPLDDDHSRKLFYNILYGSESYCPEQFKEVSTEIVEICGGLPLATISIASLLASQPVITVDFMTYIYQSLSSCFSANTTSERLKQVLNLSYNNLPRHLKTCLLYLSMYPEGSTFYKDDLVKQWMAEALINTKEGQDIKEVATSYLDELIGRRFIQPICINYNNEVVSCTMHDAVHDLIAYKSAEKNFIVAIAYSQMNMAFSHKVRRLSLQFGDTRYAKTPANIRKAQVRSLTFFGLIEFMPSISEFKLLCVLNLQVSDHGGDDDPLDLTSISELFQLRYLKIAGDICIKLPKHGLQCLETLDITDARVDMDRGVPCVPYIHLPHLLHLSLSAEINLVKWIDSLVSDGKLKYLQDLHITIPSTSPSGDVELIMGYLKFIVSSGHQKLKTIVVRAESLVKHVVVSGNDELSNVWNDVILPPLIRRFEFVTHKRVVFSRIPLLVEKYVNLCMLKIEVRDLEMRCVDILRGLPALAALSLYVHTAFCQRIMFDKAGFSVLKYFKLRFTSGVAWLKFEADAMPKLWKLKLVFDAIPPMDQKLVLYSNHPLFEHHKHGTAVISIEHMPGLKEISVKFGGAAVDVEYALRVGVKNHPSNPTINKRPVDYSCYGGERSGLKQQPDEILVKEQDEYYQKQPDEHFKQQPDEIVEEEPYEYYKQQPEHNLDEEPDDNLDEDPDEILVEEQDAYDQKQPDEYFKQQPDDILEEKPDEYYKHQPEDNLHEQPDDNLDEESDTILERKPSTARSDLEQMLVDEKAEPKALPLSLLKDITGGFSDDLVIGSGGFAVVYKGILHDRVVAVKKLSDAVMDETKFHQEVECLMQVKHKNVVRFLGYCANRQGNMEMYNGKLVMVDVHQRLLCFEYMPKGSLDKYIMDAHREWGMCYNIIKGICEGLQYLHENHIVHLDLKPANILLNNDMTPKITDFGLSRCFDENQSRDITKTIIQTTWYMSPELREGGIIACSADLYSLGVIIMEILTGQKEYQAIGDVLQSWSGRLEKSQQNTLCEQIQVCYEIALECRDFNPKKRPTSARDIIDRLHEMEIIEFKIGRHSSWMENLGLSRHNSYPKVHKALCNEMTLMLDKVSSILPSIEAAQPGCRAGIPELCNLYNVVEKGKLITQHCIECSKLYLAITGEAILSRCERIRDSFKRSLFLIQNIVPTVLANQIADVRNDLRDVKFVVDPFDEEAGKVILEMLRQSDATEELELQAFVQAASKLNLTSPKAILIERRAIKKLLDKVSGTDPKKEVVLKFFMYLVKKYGKNIKPDTGERSDNLQCENQSSPSLSFATSSCSTDGKCYTTTDLQRYEYRSSVSGETTPPAEFCCPISTKLMHDPVIITSGQTYEREYIEKWFSEGYNTCPRTQIKLENFAMIPNTCMRDLICNWCKEHGSTISDFLPNKDAYSYFPELLNGYSMSSLHNISVPPIAENARNFTIDHRISSTAFSDASYVSDSSHVKDMEEPKDSFSRFSWSADYHKYLSFQYFNQSMFLRFFCELSKLPLEIQGSSIKDLKNILDNDNEVSCAMVSNGFVEAFLEFLRNDNSSYSMQGQQAGLHFFCAFLSNSRTMIPSMHEEAFHLITSFLSSELRTEALLVLYELVRHLNRRQSRQMASVVTPPVLEILTSEDIEGLELPLKIICDLSSDADVKSDLISLGIITKLVPVLTEGSFVECCLKILRNLCDVEGATALITRTDWCLGSIAEYLDTGSPKERELAAIILLAICSRSTEDCSHVMREGVIPALVDLSVNGIDEAKTCSFRLLNLLRDLRQSNQLSNSCSQEVALPHHRRFYNFLS